jgi:predicted deacylase
MIRHLLIVTLVCLCAPAFAAERYCENDVLILDARFEGGRLDHCRFTAENSVELRFRTEDFGVDSEYAWFAFRVSAQDSREIDIRMHFPDSRARYWPKVSRDGKNWHPADEDAVARSEIGKSMTLRLAVDETGTWISAQELLTQDYYDDWLAQLDAHYELQTSEIGRSKQDRPVYLAQTNDKPEAIVLLGRQHPAEVPGAIAMREFVDVVLGSSELAREFRSRYMLLVLPLLNPDGVANGHARHNSGLADLNRDWGPFTQPETQSVAAVLQRLEERGVRPRLMLDFHATKMTPTMIFYTQMPEDNTHPRRFATEWLSQVDERIEDFEFTHDPRPPSGLDNTKNYFFSRYGIPAITYEIGDEADRQAIYEHTPAFAEEMMRVMLKAERP